MPSPSLLGFGKEDVVETRNGKLAVITGAAKNSLPSQFSNVPLQEFPVRVLDPASGKLGDAVHMLDVRDITHVVLAGTRADLEAKGILTNSGRGSKRTFVLPDDCEFRGGLKGANCRNLAGTRCSLVSKIQGSAVPRFAQPIVSLQDSGEVPVLTETKAACFEASQARAEHLIRDLEIAGIEFTDGNCSFQRRIQTFEPLAGGGLENGRSIAPGPTIGGERTTMKAKVYTLSDDTELERLVIQLHIRIQNSHTVSEPRRLDEVLGGVSWRAGYCVEGNADVAVAKSATISISDETLGSVWVSIKFVWFRMMAGADYDKAAEAAEEELEQTAAAQRDRMREVLQDAAAENP